MITTKQIAEVGKQAYQDDECRSGKPFGCQQSTKIYKLFEVRTTDYEILKWYIARSFMKFEDNKLHQWFMVCLWGHSKKEWKRSWSHVAPAPHQLSFSSNASNVFSPIAEQNSYKHGSKPREVQGTWKLSAGSQAGQFDFSYTLRSGLGPNEWKPSLRT